MKISVNVKYMLMQSFFWMLFCVATGFTSLYLLAEGASNSLIGIATAMFCTVSAIIQPWLGRICDKSEKITWKNMIICLTIAEFILCILMGTISGKIFSVISMGLLMLLANVTMPFVNSALFYYKANDNYINFGVARGLGSGCYALLAFIIGESAAIFGTKTVPLAGIIITFLFIAIVISMPYDGSLDNSSNLDKESKNTNILEFVKKYPSFILMLVGYIFLATTHNVVMTYLLQIIQNVGGDSGNLGTTIAIQAFVEIPVMFLFSRIIKKYSASKLMVFAAFGYVIKATLFFLAGNITAIYFVGLAQIISFAIFASASVYYTGDTVMEEDRTTGQAFMTSIIAIGMVLGNFIGGFIIDMLGVKHMLSINIGIGIVGLIIVLISQKVNNKV